MFEDMIRSIERMRSEVTKLIGINEKAAFNQAEALIERLEQEIDELKKKESGLKQLYSTEDHIHFLQVIYSLEQLFNNEYTWSGNLIMSMSNSTFTQYYVVLMTLHFYSELGQVPAYTELISTHGFSF